MSGRFMALSHRPLLAGNGHLVEGAEPTAQAENPIVGGVLMPTSPGKLYSNVQN